MSVLCPACGSQQPSDAAFCPICGAPRPRADAPTDLAAPGQGVPSTATPSGRSGSGPDGAGGAAGEGCPTAGVGRRVAASVLDLLAVAMPTWLMLLVGVVRAPGGFDAAGPVALVAAAQPWAVGAGVWSLAAGIGLCWWEGATGAAVGGRVLGVRAVDREHAAPLGFWRALVRALVVAAGSVVPVLGTLLVLLSPLFDGGGRGQGWHDKAAGAVVLRVRPPRGARAPDEPPAHEDGVAAQASASPRAGTAPAAPAAPEASPWAISPWAAAMAGPDGARAPTPPGASAAPDESVVRGAPPPGKLPVRLMRAPVRPVRLVLPDGTSVVVTGPSLVGRDPQAETGGWALVPLDDPGRSVSKTHAELDVDPDGLWVTDRGSTNGTVVAEPGRPLRAAAPGTRTRVPHGSRLHLGDLRLAVQGGV
ncbi:RDD family protein [Xylanimonas allomyrinae]|nr:RDD family protein [Xylanimonas allomyrinae]